ncbi:glycoside hydrolase family 13 protein [Wolfiporia cocos MD-104 SS10]|uniref:Glycoside hydrolase family 13 protein n=1 Tax=Wolfiporia cocos (strain MD-104) TaxID=742152 RepID=A0A2H3K191_WOLCO|nr:glycoside hydrolase family 13 protein [Wolfiporia cocos MD-104 SS10]
MGFDAVVANIEGAMPEGQVYQGYWVQDQNVLNDHFGMDTDLKLLSTMLHKMGMYLMIDVVVKHMAATTLPPNHTVFTPFDEQVGFCCFCWITDYNNQTDVEQC